MKYTVNVKEILSRDVEVEAESAEEAESIVEDMYQNQEIILDYEDFIGEPEIEVKM